MRFTLEGRRLKHLDGPASHTHYPLLVVRHILEQSLAPYDSPTPPASIEEVRRFLSACEYRSDREVYGKVDHWARPWEFEKNRKGDCEDAAIWAWHWLLRLGKKARFAWRSGHAFVLLFEAGAVHFLDRLPFLYPTGLPSDTSCITLPPTEALARALEDGEYGLVAVEAKTLREIMRPVVSVDGRLRFFRHHD